MTAGLAALAIAGMAGSMGYAQQPAAQEGPFRAGRMGRVGPGGPGGFAGRFGLPLGQLDLTDGQRDQVRTIVDNHRVELQLLGQRMQEARKAMRQAETADAFNEGAIRAASDTLHAAMTDGAVLRARMRSEVLQVLTPEQRAKARQLQAEREQRLQQRQQRMKERMQNRLQRQQPKPPAPAGL
jgi:protein CpxP